MSESSGSTKLDHATLEPVFQYRTMSVEHLQDMQDYMDTLREKGLFSNNTVFRSYVDDKSFRLPTSFPDAKYLIAVAVYTPLARIGVPYKGRIHSVLIPPNYRVSEFTPDQIRDTVISKAIGCDGYRVEDARRNVFRKHLAVRSGLAKYGRNNICYVHGMGSMLGLYAYFTDYVFDEDHWDDVQMMDSCRKCKVCLTECPTGAISTDRFVIDVDRCIPLYNEIAGEIPAWVPKDAHDSLIGCMHCQLRCPANRHAVSRVVDIGSLTEDEALAIVNEVPSEDAARALCTKLRVSTAESVSSDLQVFSRNLRTLLDAQSGIE